MFQPHTEKLYGDVTVYPEQGLLLVQRALYAHKLKCVRGPKYICHCLFLGALLLAGVIAPGFAVARMRSTSHSSSADLRASVIFPDRVLVRLFLELWCHCCEPKQRTQSTSDLNTAVFKSLVLMTSSRAAVVQAFIFVIRIHH